MVTESKNLLLKDLGGRILYGVKCEINDNKPYTLSKISNDYDGVLIGFKEQKNGFNMEVYISEVKPYLYPLSSISEKQNEELKKIFPVSYSIDLNDDSGDILIYDNEPYVLLEYYEKFIDFCHKYHFDYRGLIKMGLAIDCSNLNVY